MASYATAFLRHLTRAPDGTLDAVTLESAERIVLTSDADDPRPEACQIDPKAHLTVYADEVVISGPMRLPARAVKIFARTVRGERLAGKDPAIVVDGRQEAIAPPPPLNVGVSPPDNPSKTKLKIGKTGANGWSNRVWPIPDPNSVEKDGERGWSGRDHPVEMNGERGAPGAPGEAGGSILVLCRQLVGDRLSLSARGGPGGTGQQGQPGATGGRGGNGADAQTTFLGWKAATCGGNGGDGGEGGHGGQGGAGGAGGVIAVWTVVDSNGQLSSTVTDPGAPGVGGKGGKRGEPGEGGEPGHGNRDIHPPAINLSAQSEAAFKKACTFGYWGAFRGNYGAWGKDGDDGDPGAKAAAGKKDIRIGDKLATIAELAAASSVTQLRMMCDTALLDAGLIVPDAADPAFVTLGDRLAWIAGLLYALHASLDNGDPRKRLVSSLSGSAYALIRNLVDGRNAFGKSTAFVPIASLATYQTRLKTTTANLKAIEAPAEAYRRAVSKGEDAKASLNLARAQAKGTAAYFSAELATTASCMSQLQSAIGEMENKRIDGGKVLLPLLNQIADEVRKSFSLDPQLFLNALSQLAFTDGSNPVKAGAMIVGQVGSVIADAATNIINDSGDKIDKRYVLGRIKAFASDRLQGELADAAGGFVDASGSYRYLADLTKFNELCEGFLDNPQLPDARQLRTALIGQIEVVQQRNRLVDQYNDCLRRSADLRAQLDKLAYEQQRLDDRTTASADPTSALAAGRVAGLHDRARWEALRELYYAQRAYTFWALDPDASLANLIGDARSITALDIENAGNDLFGLIGGALESARRTPSRFPANERSLRRPDNTEWLPAGVLVVLARADHGPLFSDLELLGEMAFELLPSSPASDPPEPLDGPVRSIRFFSALTDEAVEEAGGAEAETNPFADMANVRLTKIRAFFDEESPAGRRSVHLVHSGIERFTRRDGKLFPSDGYCSHEPVDVTFSYTADEYRFDRRLGFSAAVLAGVRTEDGDLDFPIGDSALPQQSKYAPVGPFGRWRLIVRPKANPGLDLAKVKRILIDFHGFHEPML